jgi:hypothetical protein
MDLDCRCGHEGAQRLDLGVVPQGRRRPAASQRSGSRARVVRSARPTSAAAGVGKANADGRPGTGTCGLGEVCGKNERRAAGGGAERAARHALGADRPAAGGGPAAAGGGGVRARDPLRAPPAVRRALAARGGGGEGLAPATPTSPAPSRGSTRRCTCSPGRRSSRAAGSWASQTWGRCSRPCDRGARRSWRGERLQPERAIGGGAWRCPATSSPLPSSACRPWRGPASPAPTPARASRPRASWAPTWSGSARPAACPGSQAHLRWHAPWLGQPGSWHLVESALAAVRALAGWLGGSGLHLLEVAFARAAPDGVPLEEYRRLFRAPGRPAQEPAWRSTAR